MQIPHTGAFGFLGAIRQSDTSLSKILEKLATGKRINRASDDAAGLSIAEALTSQVRGFQEANTNVDYAEAAQYIAEGAGNEVSDILQRQRELAVQASNGTLTANDRQALNAEFQQLNQELTRIADSSQFNTQNLTNGTGLAAGGGTVLAGPNPGSELPVQGANFTAGNLGTSALNILTPQGANAALSGVDNAIQNVNGQRTTLGANINRLEHARNTNDNQATNTQDAESRIRDEDFAQGIMEKTRDQLLNQSATLTLRNFNEINRNNMLFLLGQ